MPVGVGWAMKRRSLVVGVATAAVVAAGAGTAWYFGAFADPSVSEAPERDVPAAATEVVASGLEVPWGIDFLPDGTALVAERDSAKILSVAPDGPVTEVQQLAEVAPAGEGGLLGLAVSPTYDEDQWVYVYYTTAEDNRIVRLKLGGAPEPILTGIPFASNHNGGRIAFGPDGMLYAGTGDAAEGDNAQSLASLGGKILRMTPEGAPAEGNPYEDSLVWTHGHRNVQGLAWDDAGQMYASEFGQNTYDELNKIDAGNNYGWPVVEGVGDDPQYTNPIATWATSDASPSGIAFFDGNIYMACLRGARLYSIEPDGSAAEALFVGQYGRLRTAVVAPDGSLWVTTSNHDGRGSPAADDDKIIRYEP